MEEEKKLLFLKKLFGDDYHKIGDEYLFYCPNRCHQFKNKLSVNFKKNKYRCWICNYGGNEIAYLVKKFFPDAFREYLELFPIVSENRGQENKTEIENLEAEENRRIALSFLHYNVPVVDMWKNLPKEVSYYFEKKKITKTSAFLWNIRISNPFDGWIYVPSFSEAGEVDYYIKRYVGSDNRYSFKFYRPRKRCGVFNKIWLSKNNSDIVVVENVFDAMRFDINAVEPVLGSFFSHMHEFYTFCKEYGKKIKIFFDPDALKKSIDMYEFLGKEGIESEIINNVFGKSIDELNSGELNYLLKNTFSKSEYFKLFISFKVGGDK